MNSDFTDKAKEIRKGEELDIGALSNWLKSNVEGFTGDLEVKQFPGGYSNLTYLLKFGDREYVLRRPPFGANIRSAHDMGREFRVLSLLKPIYNQVPNPVIYNEDDSLIGAPFYIMERVNGVILRGQVPKGLNLDPETMHRLSKLLIDNLAELHRIDVAQNGLADLGKPEGYVQRQVEGWIRRYYKAETDKLDGMDKLAEWMPKNLPASSQVSFIHNDYKYDNLVLEPGNLHSILAVLDWEMATVGDPLMDLGTTLAYWAEAKDNDILKPFNLSWLPGNLSRIELADRYAEGMDRVLSPNELLFYYVFGVFKIGVIGQQIYYRYKKGFTKDPRFAAFIYLIKACAQNGVKALNSGKISS